MGDSRYFMAPKGLISPDEVGPWGLVEVTRSGRGLVARVVKVSETFETNKRAEVGFLTSIIRRLEISTAVFVRADDAMLPKSNSENVLPKSNEKEGGI